MNVVLDAPAGASSAERVRLVGRLDMVRASDASFALVMEDGRVEKGVRNRYNVYVK